MKKIVEMRMKSHLLVEMYRKRIRLAVSSLSSHQFYDFCYYHSDYFHFHPLTDSTSKDTYLLCIFFDTEVKVLQKYGE